MVNVTGITATNYTALAGTLAAGTAYTWKVNATGLGGTSAFSTAFSFNTTAAAATGLLHVQTSPAVPSVISLNGIPRDSWGINFVKLPAGTYTLSFSGVTDYHTPTQVSVSPEWRNTRYTALTTPITIVAGQTTDVTANFTLLGNLHVTTTPAVPATITVNGIAREDWGLWTNFPAGSYTVAFGNVDGYTTPAPQTVTVTAGATTTVNGTYTASAGTTYPPPTAGLFHVQTSPAVRTQYFPERQYL